MTNVMKEKLLIPILLLLLLNFGLHAQNSVSMLGNGVLAIVDYDSLNVYEQPNLNSRTGFPFENCTRLPEYNDSTLWTQFSIVSWKDSAGWYKVIANPYYGMDENGNSYVTDTFKIFYIPQNSQVVFQTWEDYLPGKYIYKYSDNLYINKTTKKTNECMLDYCIRCVRIDGDWMEVQTLEDHDCTPGDIKCRGRYWLHWRDNTKMLLNLTPY